MTDLSYRVTRLLKEFSFLTPVWERRLSFLLPYKVSRHQARSGFAVLVWPVKPHLGPGFSGDVVIHRVTPPDSGCSCKHSPPLKALSKRTSEAPRKGGVFSQACKGFTEVTFLASPRTSSAEPRVGSGFQWMIYLLQHQDQPFIPYSCSLYTAYLETLVIKLIYQTISSCPGSPAG